MYDAPHMTAFAAEYPLDAESFGLGIHLAVELFHQFVIGKGTEVAALG